MDPNSAKNHQPNLPAKAFNGKSPGKWDYADAVVELDHHVGQILDTVKELGIEKNTLVFFTVDNGAMPGDSAPAPELGWMSAEKYVASLPEIYDVMMDPQERVNNFMNSQTETTWSVAIMTQELQKIMQSNDK